MNGAYEHLRSAADRLFRGRTSGNIVGKSPMSEAVDKARAELNTLIKFFGGDGFVPNVQKALRDIMESLAAFKSNEDVSAAYMDLVEAQMVLEDATYDVAPDGETSKKPRR